MFTEPRWVAEGLWARLAHAVASPAGPDKNALAVVQLPDLEEKAPPAPEAPVIARGREGRELPQPGGEGLEGLVRAADRRRREQQAFARHPYAKPAGGPDLATLLGHSREVTCVTTYATVDGAV